MAWMEYLPNTLGKTEPILSFFSNVTPKGSILLRVKPLSLTFPIYRNSEELDVFPPNSDIQDPNKNCKNPKTYCITRLKAEMTKGKSHEIDDIFAKRVKPSKTSVSENKSDSNKKALDTKNLALEQIAIHQNETESKESNTKVEVFDASGSGSNPFKQAFIQAKPKPTSEGVFSDLRGLNYTISETQSFIKFNFDSGNTKDTWSELVLNTSISSWFLLYIPPNFLLFRDKSADIFATRDGTAAENPFIILVFKHDLFA
ncbi:hypothetical protein BB560_006140, partial [Smittium megazygosporum]